MKDWRDYYQRRLLSAEEAASMVKSGDTVAFTMGREAWAVGLAVAARKEELKGVKVVVPTPGYDFGWYDPGWDDSFPITAGMITDTCQRMVDERRCDIAVGRIIAAGYEVEQPDIVVTEISPPDEKGFCSFGNSVWNKKDLIRRGTITIAEVNKNLIRTYGDNYIHVSAIDYFVEHISSGKEPGMGSLAGRILREPEPFLKDIAKYVSQLIQDGDTIQIGVGRTTEPLVRLGLLQGKQDIGFHSEATPPGIITLVKEGIITGKCKTINPGKVVVTSIGGSTREEMAWVEVNPLFWLVEVSYLEDIRVISAHDNFVAINNALMVDLMGQVASSGIGDRFVAATGGQIAFAYGALLSQGGRSLIILPSTAKGGEVSRIVSTFPPGTPVTLQREAADIVVTEYGVARLRGKTLRKRAEELIAIAHPDFRAELKKEALRRFYP